MDPYPGSYWILILLLLDALLTAGREALTQLPDSGVKKMASSADAKERFIAALLERPSSFLDGAKLAGFACGIAAALYAWPLLLRGAALLAGRLPFDPPYRPFYRLAVLVAFLLVVLVLDVVCRLIPRRVATHHPMGIARALCRPCWLAACIARPFTLLNAKAAGVLSLLFGARTQEEPAEATEEEIRMMVDVGSEKGSIEQSEKDMINNIFEFDDRSVSEVMTHRTDMTAVPKDATLQQIVEIATETGFSRIPVYDDDIDDIMGILYVKDLLRLIGRREESFRAEEYMRPALFVPENMGCVDLFAQFKQKKVMVAIAVDEYGGTAGIVSMEDLLESIVGNIQDEYDDEEEEISRLGEDCWSLDGTVALDEVDRLFDIELDEEDSDYDTIGGLLTEKLQRIPVPGEHPSVTMQGVVFTVLLVEERRIARVRAERAPDETRGEP